AEKLGLNEVMAFDIQAACSGFIFSLATAEALMKSLGARKALVVGADTLSRMIDWNDRNTAVLFGDGAGACILESSGPEADPVILASYLKTYSEGAQLITCEEQDRESDQNVSSPLDERRERGPYLQMKGKSVFKAGVQLMTESVFAVLNEAGLSIDDVALFVPHQSNIRMIDMVSQAIGLEDKSKIATTIDSVGNTSAASIPITLAHYDRAGALKRGDLVLLTAVGSGISYGSLLVRW
ncbi:MAG: ketoacyl-ACP synthase III, partial [Bdellovibrionales bacterium]|nr:ketoacyl-ACP synthase III [Bdellovibrionales bacterium]